MDLELFDTTPRDGSQDAEVHFPLEEKLKYMILAHDIIPSMIIEMSYALSDPNPYESYQAAFTINNGIQDVISTFGSTHHPRMNPEKCKNMQAMLSTEARIATIFGKTWIPQIKTLGISKEIYFSDSIIASKYGKDAAANIEIIKNSVRYLKENGMQRVIYDAEHFFSGLHDSCEYAIETLHAAIDGGADTVVLCDTKGGLVPHVLRGDLKKMKSFFDTYPDIRFGIHCHDDTGCAVANTLDFVYEMKDRKIQVQGTINGYGERCGNADLITIIANLVDKMGYSDSTIQTESFSELAHKTSHILGVHLNSKKQYVGSLAFAHKAGMHAHASRRSECSTAGYCHAVPEIFGNEEKFLITPQSGKEAYAEMAKQFGYVFDKNGIEVASISESVCWAEKQGYRIHDQKAEHLLMLHDLFGEEKYDILPTDWNTQSWFNTYPGDVSRKSQTVVSGIILGADTGYFEDVSRTFKGPVDSQYKALKKSLKKNFSSVDNIRLVDFKVDLVKHRGTESPVRVSITYAQDGHMWSTQGVSENILEASLEAIVKGFRYCLLRNEIDQYRVR
jgi:2-isopropylmalate synthase